MSDDKSYNDEGSSKSGSSAEDAEAGSGGAGENGAEDAAESGKDQVVPAVIIRDILCEKEKRNVYHHFLF